MRARRLQAKKAAAKKRSHNPANAYPSAKETAGITEDHFRMAQRLETLAPCSARSVPTPILAA